MGGTSRGQKRYDPQQAGSGGLAGQGGAHWELPKASPGAPQGIAKNWVTPQAPAGGDDGRAQLATLLANAGHGPDAIKQLQAARMRMDGSGMYTPMPGYAGAHRGWTGGSMR